MVEPTERARAPRTMPRSVHNFTCGQGSSFVGTPTCLVWQLLRHQTGVKTLGVETWKQVLRQCRDNDGGDGGDGDDGDDGDDDGDGDGGGGDDDDDDDDDNVSSEIVVIPLEMEDPC